MSNNLAVKTSQLTNSIKQMSDYLKEKIDNNTTQLNDNTNEISAIKTEYAKKTEVNKLASDKADKTDLEATNTNVAKNTTDLAVQTARIDSFTKLAEGSTTGDAELVDARVGADGVTYKNVGSAIREQFTDLKNDLVNLENNVDAFGGNEYVNITTTFTDGKKVSPTNGQLLDNYSNFRTTDFIDVKAFDTVYFPIMRNDYHYVALYDENKDFILSGTPNKINEEHVSTNDCPNVRYFRYSFFVDDADKFYLHGLYKITRDVNDAKNKLEEYLHIIAKDRVVVPLINCFSMMNSEDVAFGYRIVSSGAIWIDKSCSIMQKRIYAKKGSTIYFTPTSEVVKYSVIIEDGNNNNISFYDNLTSDFVLSRDGYIRITVKRESGTAVLEDLETISGFIINDNTNDLVIDVHNSSELKSALNRANIVNIMNDITINETMKVWLKDVVINGNNYTINTTSSDCVFDIRNNTIKLNNLKVDCSGAETGFNVTFNAKAFFNNCEIFNSNGDGISPKENSYTYVSHCRIHDNFDEGLSTHGSCYAEVYDSEFYRNGFVVGTDEYSGDSYGGLHFGGSKMGVAIGNYCHHNATNGIAFGNMSQGTIDNDMKSIIANNITSDNGANGIVIGGCLNIRCANNTVLKNNGYALVFNPGNGTTSPSVNTGYVVGNIIKGNNIDKVKVWPGASGSDLFIDCEIEN